ncbi:MAG: hypothetical protein ABR903_02205 [Thermodesulfovibrionales bacterium]
MLPIGMFQKYAACRRLHRLHVLSLVLGAHLRLNLGRSATILMAVMMEFAIMFTCSLMAACIVETRKHFMGIGWVFTMPLFFTSNAVGVL